MYSGTEIKQYAKVKHLECIFDQRLSGESIAMSVIDQVNSCQKSQHRQNRFLTGPLHRLLCNALIQPLFDYACAAWLSNLSKRHKMRFRLQLDKRSKIRVKDLKLEIAFLIS